RQREHDHAERGKQPGGRAVYRRALPAGGPAEEHDRSGRLRTVAVTSLRPSVMSTSFDARHRLRGAGVASVLSRSAAATIPHHALLAQLVEHLHGKEGVDGSSPSEGFTNCLQ